MESSSSFPTAGYFPQRRRVLQACVNCRNRKTRCDGAKPRCRFCAAQNVECIYHDSQQLRIDPNTKVLLDRIQLLEDRILTSPRFSHSTVLAANNYPPNSGYTATSEGAAGSAISARDLEVPISLAHTGNANHVYEWPIVRHLLAQDIEESPSPDFGGYTRATDVFFETSSTSSDFDLPPESWRLFHDVSGDACIKSSLHYRNLVHLYFAGVNTFFPLLSRDNIIQTLDAISSMESGGMQDHTSTVPPAEYCLVLLVLCLATFVASGKSAIRLHVPDRSAGSHNPDYKMPLSDEVLWGKCKLLLGFLSSAHTLESAQCSMLASLYLGARGLVAEAYHWTHATAVKCEAMANIGVTVPGRVGALSESFRRLYWVAFILEGDFVSEVSITLPSGLARFEDLVPYPVFEHETRRATDANAPHSGSVDIHNHVATDQDQELFGFQISTNASLRRCLNRVNNVIYDVKEQSRITQPENVAWLLRVTQDLWAHYSALHRNVPDFLLTSAALGNDQQSNVFDITSSSPQSSIDGNLSNNPWNVVRLRGRYFAGQYIIHRPFIEYVLRNSEHLDANPFKSTVFDKCRACLEGCRGFIKTFDVDPANSITCLFASGMVTFTMTIILRISTIFPPLRGIMPADVEDTIRTGKRILERFSASIKEFAWHLSILQRLDASCDSM
ncbi:hypothetical protein BX600DRAFT_383208 [Xylariales sp. PMI_506]|nr:hypothetical protein BX600DRAFT_383208 [Xylariales sp. PMI_506]